MNRTALLAGLGALVITGGVAVAAPSPSDRPIPLLAAGASHRTDERERTATTTTAVERPSLTTITGVPWAPDETLPVLPVDPPETTIPGEPATTVPRSTIPPETTTTTGPPERPAPGIRLACGSREDVVCEWGDLPAHTAYQVVMREHEGPSQAIWRTDDLSIHRYVDETAEAGVRYVYRVSAYAEDGTFLATSNPVAVVPGEPAPETTTTTTAAPRPATGSIRLECVTPGAEDPGDVVCEWGDLPEHTAYQVVMREHEGPSQPIWRTDDLSIHRYVDETATSGVTYSYRISAFAEDGTFLGTSNPVRVTPGERGEGA